MGLHLVFLSKVLRAPHDLQRRHHHGVLVQHELPKPNARARPQSTKDHEGVPHIATRHASGEEAVGAVFIQGDEKEAPCGSWGHHTKSPLKAQRGALKAARGGNATTPTSCNHHQQR
jgi:hypothetical protein